MTDLKKLFQEMEFDKNDSMKYNDRVLFVDGLNTFIRNWCAIPTMNENGNHVGGVTGFLKSIGALIRNLKPTRVVLVFDGAGGSQRRRVLYPNYKSQRKPITHVNRTYDLETPEQEQEGMRDQLVALMSILSHLPVTVIAIDNIEADDVIAYASEWVVAQGGKAIILSTDKDFYQMINEHIHLWHPIKKKTYTIETVLEDYKILPDNFVLYRALTGDKSDNVPGVKGIGEIKPNGKGGSKLLKYYPEFSTQPITLDFLFQRAEERKKESKVYESILNSKELIERNLQLMTLRDVNVSASAKLKMIGAMQNHIPRLDKTTLTKLLLGGKFMSTLPNYDVWLATTFVPLLRFYGHKQGI
jgi:5'-3' exonuclease